MLPLVACAALAGFAGGSVFVRGALVLACVAAGLLFARVVRDLERQAADARRLRNYRLVERLGQGGMGEVWRAEHHLLPRPAAIKFIRPEAFGTLQEQEATVQRFLEEARATVGLSSPHTIEIYDFGVTADGTLCYVMEYLEGVDLDTLVQRHGPLPPARVVYLLRQACISLAEAHAQDFVHRDIKPANLYVCRKGLHHDFVKVLDFGIATRTRAGKTDAGDSFEIVGTPSYLAPETLRGRCDARSDLYALGCVAYFLLTGHTVFSGETVTELVTHHVRTRPIAPSQRLGRQLPRDLELVVLRCLAKNPDDRFSSVSEFSQALARCDVGPIWTPGQAMTWWRERS
jgi:serine/threonine-protein kinase